ncbi:MAG: hypothetical protein MJ200_01350 [Mycoplasmoidaceae bacterium]|nr:hypothetical protein [Mycoplasmoidaceae bacterium]
MALSQYCEKENIKIAILKKAYSPKIQKALKNNKIFIVDELDQLNHVFAIKN